MMDEENIIATETTSEANVVKKSNKKIIEASDDANETRGRMLLLF